MKNIIVSLIIISLSSGIASAQKTKQLRFRHQEFKIVQFTDTHINWPNGDNLQSFDLIKSITDFEKPDLVILTGDIITGNDPQEAFVRMASIFEKAMIPWAIVFGNHESEHNMKRKPLADLVEKLPYCLNCNPDTTIGFSTFVLPVYGSGKVPSAILYCMDSNDYSLLQPKIKGYGWFSANQINWYRSQSQQFKKLNNNSPIPALAFFHIPLPEYSKVAIPKSGIFFGTKREPVNSPDINSGMFTAMVESGDVMGAFVGHDHNNDFIGVYYDIALAYGRVSKLMKDKADPMMGARVIVLKEGKRQFDTWIRDVELKQELECTYPGHFTLN